MKIQANYNQSFCNQPNYATSYHQRLDLITDLVELNLLKNDKKTSFKGQLLQQAKDYLRFHKVKNYVKKVAEQLEKTPDRLMPLRNLSMEAMEGLQ